MNQVCFLLSTSHSVKAHSTCQRQYKLYPKQIVKFELGTSLLIKSSYFFYALHFLHFGPSKHLQNIMFKTKCCVEYMYMYKAWKHFPKTFMSVRMLIQRCFKTFSKTFPLCFLDVAFMSNVILMLSSLISNQTFLKQRCKQFVKLFSCKLLGYWHRIRLSILWAPNKLHWITSRVSR